MPSEPSRNTSLQAWEHSTTTCSYNSLALITPVIFLAGKNTLKAALDWIPNKGHPSFQKSFSCSLFTVAIHQSASHINAYFFLSGLSTRSPKPAVSQQPTNEYHQDHTAAFCSSIIEQLISPSHTHFIPFLLLYQWKSLEEKKNWDRLVTPFHI